MYCVTMQASTVDHGQWNRGRSCLEGTRSNRNHSVNVVACLVILFNKCGNYKFHRQQKWGLNTYLYAPKDDYKHRMFWRELYSVEEAGNHSNSMDHLIMIAIEKYTIYTFL